MLGPEQFGVMERLKVRDYFANEANDFTPWLSADTNIKILGDALGLELEVEGSEENVGPYRADILCVDLSDNSKVLIENQLEKSDHIHLGQLLNSMLFASRTIGSEVLAIPAAGKGICRI